MPASTTPYQAGKTYAIGDAVNDPKSGLTILVSRVRFDATLPGLSAGEQWALIDLTFGNKSAAPITVRPLGDLGVKARDATRFMTEPVFADRQLGDRAGGTPMANTEIAPGQAVHRLLAVIVPTDAKDLALWYAPGLIVGTTPPDAAKWQVSLGR